MRVSSLAASWVGSFLGAAASDDLPPMDFLVVVTALSRCLNRSYYNCRGFRRRISLHHALDLVDPIVCGGVGVVCGESIDSRISEDRKA